MPTAPGVDGATEWTGLAIDSQQLVRDWLNTAEHSPSEQHPSARRLAAVLSDPAGLDFTVGFIDRVIGTEDDSAAAAALTEIAASVPHALGLLDRAQIRLGGALARMMPRVVVPVARTRMRTMVGHMIVDARDRPLTAAIARLTAGGHRLNINPLGEAVLGDDEADNRLADARRLLARDDVDYVSIKVSSVVSQLSMWAFDETVRHVVDRLVPLYLDAAQAPRGEKFINLDMEEYRDLELTIAVFTRLLSRPDLAGLEAGIVLQAYLPDALGAAQRLSAFAAARAAAGGPDIKIRLVKGANLAMETVHAEIAGWPRATCPTKAATDANYKRVLTWLLTADRMHGLRVGVAGHNLFDIAFAHLLAGRRGVSDRVEIEMLQGMATQHAAAISGDVGRLLLYVPAVRPREFDVAISYLVRRLEENAADENFMSGIFQLTGDSEVFRREAGRFAASVRILEETIGRDGDDAPGPARSQDRAAGEETPVPPISTPLPAFANEPDTDPALPANQRWAREAIARASTPGWLESQPVPPAVSRDEVDIVVSRARAAAVEWRARSAAERSTLLYRTAEILARRRGHLISLAAAEAGKSVSQSDPEISEAIDFARYYAHRALALDGVEGARFIPDEVIVVTPPWNFPIAIPAGGTFAALAAGAAVIHKPSVPTPRCSMAILEALWDAGVPRDACQGVFPDEGPAGRALIEHPNVDRVLLTGSSQTAALFASWRPSLKINAETSGKNALVITPSADRDLAIADLVDSAFGHAGQKCSAASLGILVGRAYESQRFRRQLVDAASSLVVGPPTDLAATVGPLTELPSTKLMRALTTVEPGERWLLEPRRLDDAGRLWSPGIKDGVAPGSFFHHTECFGPVLGLMRADDLDDALRLQNDVGFGLTAGLHSLDPREVRAWLDRAEAGNLYVNRGITGAIVRRQPFGGWKRSSVGLGSKAGGPNYLMQMGSWVDDPVHRPTTGPPTPPRVPAVAAFVDTVAAGLPAARAEWLRAAAADDDHAWASEFGVPRDETGLVAEANIFRYRPTGVTLRVTADSEPADIARLVAAGLRSGATMLIVPEPVLRPDVDLVLDAASHAGVTVAASCDDAEFVTVMRSSGMPRIRSATTLSDRLRGLLARHREVTLLDDAVTASGRVELRNWLVEQSVSMTVHRFGNEVRAFRELAVDLEQESALAAVVTGRHADGRRHR
ncbi:proline dehydrogenase family protein [Gordonia shandongensis]|uniref:proline dehydrogenase family protein n=1 Tax=Gordonia shandongensis TaxID=376351 RepID=UPI0009FE2175|nr:bifunctional proline dehydrogenase/L-glutamate gamma-semialdehyde dehydrogenase [Gordonia shandongensis]